MMDGSMRRGTNHSGRTTPRRRNQSASATGQGFTPIQEPVNTHLDSKRRYRRLVNQTICVHQFLDFCLPIQIDALFKN